MKYIVFDLEFNQAFDFADNNPTLTDPKCTFEVIQIGAVTLDENFNIVDKRNFLIKPTIYPRMHPYVEKITGLTYKFLKNEKTFPDVFDDFIEYIGPTKVVLCTWGGNDISILYKNILYYKLNHKLLTKKHLNIQILASMYLKKPVGMSIGLKNAVLALNLDTDIMFHDALNDAIYTARIFKIVKKDNMQIQVFNINNLKAKIEDEKLKIYTPLLYSVVERDLGRKLTKKEKDIVRKIYDYGREHKFDMPEGVENK